MGTKTFNLFLSKFSTSKYPIAVDVEKGVFNIYSYRVLGCREFGQEQVKGLCGLVLFGPLRSGDPNSKLLRGWAKCGKGSLDWFHFPEVSSCFTECIKLQRRSCSPHVGIGDFFKNSEKSSFPPLF